MKCFLSGALETKVLLLFQKLLEVYAPVDGEVVLVADTKTSLAFNSNIMVWKLYDTYGALIQ